MTNQELVLNNLQLIRETCQRLIPKNKALAQDTEQDIILYLLELPPEKIDKIEANQRGYIYTVIRIQVFSKDSKHYRSYRDSYVDTHAKLHYTQDVANRIDITSAFLKLTELEQVTIEAIVKYGNIKQAAKASKVHHSHLKRLHQSAIAKLKIYLNYEPTNDN